MNVIYSDKRSVMLVTILSTDRQVTHVRYEQCDMIPSTQGLCQEPASTTGYAMLEWSWYVDGPVQPALSPIPPTSPPTPDDPDDQEM